MRRERGGQPGGGHRRRAGDLLALLATALLPRRVLLSVFGAAGLLVYVAWTILHWFPGESRVPVLILVSGALLIAIAALLARHAHRFRPELGHGPGNVDDPAGRGPLVGRRDDGSTGD